MPFSKCVVFVSLSMLKSFIIILCFIFSANVFAKNNYTIENLFEFPNEERAQQHVYMDSLLLYLPINKRIEKAQEIIEFAIEKNNKDIEAKAWLRIGDSYLRLNSLDKSMEAYCREYLSPCKLSGNTSG